MFILTEQPFFGSEESSACFRINRLQLGLLSKGFCGQLAGYIIYMWKLSKLVVPQNDHNANKLYITRGGYPLVMLSITTLDSSVHNEKGVHLWSSVLPTLSTMAGDKPGIALLQLFEFEGSWYFKRDLQTYDEKEEEPNVPWNPLVNIFLICSEYNECI